MKKTSTFIVMLVTAIIAVAQSNDIIENYRRTQQMMIKQYEAERQTAIEQYAETVREAWEWYNTLPAIPRPKYQEAPPVVIDEEDNKKPLENNETPIEDIINPPAPQPEPKPRPTAPLDDTPSPTQGTFEFCFFGTVLNVRLDDSQKFKLASISTDNIADALLSLGSAEYDITIADCMRLRESLQLCDWAYYKMLGSLSTSFLGSDTNESELLKAYIFMKSGYAMKLCISNGKLLMLYGTQHHVYERPGLREGNLYYFPEYGMAQQIELCRAAFPYTHSMSLSIPSLPLLTQNLSDDRLITMPDYSKTTLNSNKNLIDFLNTYPTSKIGDNDVSRWALYAETPISKEISEKLYPQLLALISDKTKYDAVNTLCSWIQCSFEYEYDDVVWGRDRAFFADESLFYPYIDCEDRSILLTRIARDLLGVECLLVFYPGHLATAIALGEDAQGDYISFEGKKYIICDPTYIGASIGRTMPKMSNQSAKVIVL